MDNVRKFEPLFGEWSVEAVIAEDDDSRTYRVFRERDGKREYAAVKHIPVPNDESIVKALKEGGMDDATLEAYADSRLRDAGREIAVSERLAACPQIAGCLENAVIPREGGFGSDVFIRTALYESLIKRQKQNPLNGTETLRLAEDISAALACCEREGITHRRVRPESIFIKPDGGFALGDMSAARAYGSAEEPSDDEPAEYSAPEVIRGEEHGGAADVYSLGLIAYALMNGSRLPFEPENASPVQREKAAMRRMTGAELPAPANADAAFAGVILKACAPDKAKRFASAAELNKAVKALKTGADPLAKTACEPAAAAPAAAAPAAAAPAEETPAPAKREKKDVKKAKRDETPKEPEAPAAEPERRKPSRGIRALLVILAVTAAIAVLCMAAYSAKDYIADLFPKKEEDAFKPRSPQIVQNSADPMKARITIYARNGSVIVYEAPSGARTEYQVNADDRKVFEISLEDYLPDEPMETTAYSVQPKFYIKNADGTLEPISDMGYVMLEVPELNAVVNCGDAIVSEDGVVHITGHVYPVKAEVTADGELLAVNGGGDFSFDRTYEENGVYTVIFEAKLPRYCVFRRSITVTVDIPEPPAVMLPWDMGETRYSQRITDPNDTIELHGMAPSGSSVTAACDNELVILTEPIVGADGSFSLTATLPEAGDYEIVFTCTDPEGQVFTRTMHVQRAPDYTSYVESAWAMSYDALQRPSKQCYNIRGTVTEILEHGDYYLVKLETSDGGTLILEYHHHYAAANSFKEGKEYKWIYGFPTGKDQNGTAHVYVWFVNDK